MPSATNIAGTTRIRNLPEFQPRSRGQWRAWLQKHHASSTGVWCVYAKKYTGIPTLTYDESVEEALCFGWIDSLRHPVDDTRWRMVFTPRNPKSAWSALNRGRVARLTRAGLMKEPGLAMVRLAKKTGTWGALKAAEDRTLPPDFQAALDAAPAARKHWPNYTASQQKMLLYSLGNAKRPETRARRIARIIAIVSKNLSFAELRKNPSLG